MSWPDAAPLAGIKVLDLTASEVPSRFRDPAHAITLDQQRDRRDLEGRPDAGPSQPGETQAAFGCCVQQIAASAG
jgi:hypothetical protein